ncbi:hypothetical protein PAAG_01579 [Paracoccidioides lutzii Pb01]|uniref:DUF7600 domain-containing protein n=1 Tax=Paracoccidioides lutzii (strain ATCC MYA-826 / Pb01) TaxID=502779 RepID=C1GST4_PARBA|nr:hypothetical protein PAAG_01579 [Paracoccidioides lutzii Pb01]EEH39117.2 hypothetical protein PAAG_01579 [Paracoccidioides lutzii Pb01]
MSLYACVLCGGPLDISQTENWLNEFRSIYTNGHDWSNPNLSGVGYVQENEDSAQFTAPPDQEDRYDGPGFEETKITILPSPLSEVTQGFLPPDFQPWGFFFHPPCWELLCAAAYPNMVDIQLLNDMLRSCPQTVATLNWGHNYGGIYETEPSNWINGNDILLRRVLGYYGSSDNPNPRIVLHRQNPLEIPQIGEIIEKGRVQQSSKSLVSYINGLSSTDGHIFARLPYELRELLLCLLPSRDVRNLMLASRAFASVELSQSFWLSRFQVEYSFIFEVRKDLLPSPGIYHWKFIFDSIKAASFEVPGIQNRRRIWNLLCPLADAVVALSKSPLKGLPAHTFYNSDIPDDLGDWRRAGVAEYTGTNNLMYGCRKLYSRIVSVSGKIVGAYVSFITMTGAPFVCGFRLMRSDGESIELGRIVGQTEVYLSVNRSLSDYDTSTFCGFHLAIGERGVQGFALASPSGRLTPWAGSHKRLPKRMLVSHTQEIRALRGGFDGFKLISLEIPSGPEPRAALRDVFPWLPDIPQSNLNLHENSFPGQTAKKLHTERPITLLHFGGSGGVNLDKITSLSVWDIHAALTGIEIQYDGPVDGATTHCMGHCGTYNATISPLISPETKVTEKKTIFMIDSAGGERIVRVEFGDIKGRANGTELWFLVQTNRGRSMSFPRDKPVPDNRAMISGDDSRTITGFYSVEFDLSVTYHPFPFIIPLSI